jgi:HEAT repeat protein
VRLPVRSAIGFALIAALGLGVAGCKSDPDAPETWISKLDEKSVKVQVDAIDNLERIGDKVAVPALIAQLKKGGAVKLAAVRALGKFQDPSIAPALIEAIDLSVGSGTDEATKQGNEANKLIAMLLGDLREKAGVQPLLDLATKSKDPFVRVEAINTLGLIGDVKAVAPLSAIATDDLTDNFVTKKAIQALGNIGDPAAVPAIVKMMFRERKGVSFFPEASYAVFQIGPAASDPLLTVLEGKDADLKKFCDEHDIFIEATYAKAAQVLGDLNEKRAIPTLIKYIDYQHEDLLRQLLVRMQAADALGRMRAKEAAPVIAKQLGEEEANVRATYARALVNIGDTRIVPQLIACALKGDSMDKKIQAREACYLALSRVGEEKALAQWLAWEKAEPKASFNRCFKEMDYSYPGDKAKEEAAKKKATEHCDALSQTVKKMLDDQKSRLVAYGECKQDVGCWTKKLDDPDAKVRERAAYELGRIGDVSAMPALVKAMANADLDARYAAILAADWLITGSKEGLAAAKALVPTMEEQLKNEAGKLHFVKVNEDLKRLVVKIQRLDRIGA